MVDIYLNDPERYLYCLDWDKYGEEIAIWGVEDDSEKYQKFEYVLVPCNYAHAEYGDTGDSVANECIANRTQQQDYLSNMKMVVYSNEDTFN